MKKIIFLLMLALLAGIAFAQVASYTFGYGAGSYTEISGGTVLGTATGTGIGNPSLDNVLYTGVPLPFSFAFNGRRYSQIAVNSNGYIIFGGTTSFNESGQIAGTTVADGIAVIYGKDNQAIYSLPTVGEIRYETIGTAPNREFVIQWKNFRDYAATTDLLNFQVILTEANVIKFVYGNIIVANTETCVVGLRGTTNADFFNRTTTTSWAASTQGATNSATMAVSSTIFPASGTTYTFTPPAASAIPNVAANPIPANAATNVFATSVLSWSDGGGWTNGFKLYFGTTDPAPYVGDLGYVTSYDPPGDMAYNTPHYWKVVPYNTFGDNETGTQWSFTTASAPLTGVKQIGPGGDFENFTAAITALNGAGVGAGGVTFQVADGTYAENPPALNIGGTAANPVVFEAREGANPVLTPTGGSGTFGFKLNGASYVTFDNIDVSASNLVYGYWLVGLTGAPAANITIKNSNISPTYTTLTNYGIYSIGVTGAPNSNCVFQNNTITGAYNGIYITGSSTAGSEAANLLVQDNVISGLRNYGIYVGYAVNALVDENQIGFFSGATTAFYGVYTLGSTSTITVSDNLISGGVTSSTVYALYNSSGNAIYEYNEVSNLNNSSSSGWYGIYAGGGDTIWRFNQIKDITNTGSASTYGFYLSSGNQTILRNTFTNIATGGTSLYGIYAIGGTTTTINGNKVFNLRYTGSSSGIVYGIGLSSGTTNNVYNNMVYDLRNPGGSTAPQVRGISVTSGTTNNLWNNTVYLNAAGTNANYAAAALYITTSNTLDLRNNIFVNKSTPGSTGRNVALWKTTTGFTNFTAATDKNIYYAGEPSATNLIGYFSTTAYQTLEEFKLANVGKDQASYTEDVPFVSSSEPYDLHIDPAVVTRVEGNAIVIATVATDVDGEARSATTPDIGADEGNFLAPQGAPGLVTLLTPADGTTGINPITGTLSWIAPAEGGTVSEYWVYVATSLETIYSESFTTVALPATSLVLANVDGLDVGFSGTYYWAVQAHNSEGESNADDPAFQIWSFSTLDQMAAAATHNVGNVWPSTRKNGSIAVQNLGTTELSFTAAGSPEFEFEPARFTIPASSTYNLAYSFNAPATIGAYTGEITLTQTSPGASEIEIAVSANISTDLTVGNGTAELNIPVDPYFGYSYSQSIYYPSELSYPEGYRIERIKYYFNGYENATNTKDFVIYMGHTTEATFATTTSWVPLSALTQVYSGTQIPQLATGGYWMEFVLNTPFVYNGTDNLVIGVEENFPGYNSTSSFFNSTITTGVNRSIRYTNDTTNPDPAAPPTGTLVAGYPNTMFVVGEIPALPVAGISPETWNYGTVIVNNAPTKQFTLQNNGGGTLAVDNIYLTGDVYYSISVSPELPLNLTTGQSANFTVQYLPTVAGNHTGSVVIDSNIDDVVVALEGVCVDPRISSLPHSQNFDGVTAPALPLGWTGYRGNTGMTLNSSTSTPFSAPNNIYMYNSSYTTDLLRLISPEITVPINSTKLSFYARGGTAGQVLKVGTVSALDGTGVFTELGSFSLTTTHTQYNLQLTGYVGTDDYICFQHGQGGTYRSIYIDNFLLEEVLDNDLAATAIVGPGMGIAGQAQEYTVTVLNNGQLEQNSYNVHLKLSGGARIATLPVNAALAAGATAVHTINWTPAVDGSFQIVGEVELTGDQYAGNNETAPRAITVYPADTFISMVGNINTTTSANTTPINMYYKNNVSETIYLPHELQMASGTINSIVYHNNFTQDLTKPIKIWMKHTATANLSAGWLPFDGYTLVFDGTVNFPLGVNAVVIPLTTPFAYTGGNLAVRVYRVWEDAWWNSTNVFYNTVSTAYPNRTRHFYADQTAAMDPILMLDYLGVPVTGTNISNIANTGFIVGGATPLVVSAPEVTIAQAGANVVLNWALVNGAGAYMIYSSDNPYDWPETPTATVYTNTYQTPAVGKKFFKVVAASGFRTVDLGTVANPAKALGVDNSRLQALPLIPQRENKN